MFKPRRLNFNAARQSVLSKVFPSVSMAEAVMKTSNRLMPTLILFGLFGFFAASYFSPISLVMAEGSSRAAEAASFQADADAAQSQNCEDREVEADEGYGVSHKVIRHICR
jgi:hypothetical protein